jgi:hypothetical protein
MDSALHSVAPWVALAIVIAVKCPVGRLAWQENTTIVKSCLRFSTSATAFHSGASQLPALLPYDPHSHTASIPVPRPRPTQGHARKPKTIASAPDMFCHLL